MVLGNFKKIIYVAVGIIEKITINMNIPLTTCIPNLGLDLTKLHQLHVLSLSNQALSLLPAPTMSSMSQLLLALMAAIVTVDAQTTYTLNYQPVSMVTYMYNNSLIVVGKYVLRM